MTETADATVGAAEPAAEERAPARRPDRGSGPSDPGAAARGALGELLAPVRGRLAAAVGLQVFSAVASLVLFLCVVELGREVLGSGPVDEGRVWALVWVAVAALVLRLVTVGLAGLTTHLADNDLQSQVRRRLADRLGGVPLGWFTDRASGRVKTAVRDDVADMHHLVGHALTDMAAALVTPLAGLGYLLWVDWRLTLVTLIPVALFVAAHAVMMRGFGEHMDRYNEATARVNAAVVEFVQGVAVVKTFGQTAGRTGVSGRPRTISPTSGGTGGGRCCGSGRARLHSGVRRRRRSGHGGLGRTGRADRRTGARRPVRRTAEPPNR